MIKTSRFAPWRAATQQFPAYAVSLQDAACVQAAAMNTQRCAAPDLDASGPPLLGRSMSLMVAHPRPGARLAVVGFGASDRSWRSLTLPFDLGPLGAPRCAVLSSLDGSMARPLVDGQAVFPVRIPNHRSLIGGTFYNQAAIIDPSANRLGLLLTSAGKGRIGTCVNGRTVRTSGKIDVPIPRTSQLRFPGMTAEIRYEGTHTKRYCSDAQDCTFSADDTLLGGKPPSWSALSSAFLPFVNRVSARVCAEVRKHTIGTPSCRTTLETLRVAPFRIWNSHPFVSLSRTCAGDKYTGAGTFKDGVVTGSGKTDAKLAFSTITTRFTVSGTVGGTWAIVRQGGRDWLRVKLALPSLKIKGSFVVPVINKRVSVEFTIPTPELEDAVEVRMPAIPNKC